MEQEQQLFKKLKALVSKPENGLQGATVTHLPDLNWIVIEVSQISAYSLARIVGVLKRYTNTRFFISPGGPLKPMKVELTITFKTN